MLDVEAEISREAIFVNKTVTNDSEKKRKEEKKYEEDEKRGWKMKTTSSALAMVVATSLAVADCSRYWINRQKR